MIHSTGILLKFIDLEDGAYFRFIYTKIDVPPNGIRISYLPKNDLDYSIHSSIYRKEDFCLARNMEDSLSLGTPIYPNMKVIRVLRDGGFTKMTRQEHIDHAMVLINGCPIRRWAYEALYRDLIGKEISCSPLEEAGFTIYPTWDELIMKLKPWLASDEVFNKHFNKE